MEYIFGVLSLGILYLILKNESNKSRAYQKGRSDVIDNEYPYIVKAFSYLYDTMYSKSNYKELEEAIIYAKKATSEFNIGGWVSYEKAEIWHHEELKKSFLSQHRIKIENIDGFNVKLYNGEVLKNSKLNLEISQICSYKAIKIRLTNGEVHLIKRPRYSSQKDCLIGQFITYFRENNREKSQEYNSIPIAIIKQIISYN